MSLDQFPKQHTDTHPPETNELDRDRLNSLTKAANQKGSCFGRDLTLEEADRHQIGVVLGKAKQMIEHYYTDPNWATFMALVDEGNKKGILVSFTNNPGTEVPSWCIDGGDNTEVSKVRIEKDGKDSPGIQVPTTVFNLFHWTRTIEQTDRYQAASDEALKGTCTVYLGRNLEQLAGFIKASETNEA